ncbi:MAG: polyprenyl diphosphate synthase [SAR86 cluster bacterium]|nr:polyprenyl diphosphate synthase [SAR86 cluster bacterium]MDG1949135.1 polyprenyl diphosphate synthase [SAR86 cluster bacterium]MDG2091732.1 polyprenyl diphosphate synthase [SAR86 cluster bacterium]|tara:strand:- start:6 stop:734 length:729 start_codon:yes stop_codon:yes gene_type:complete
MAKPLKNLVQNHLGNVAIIMDGNGRWAKKNALKISKGHEKGVSIVKEIVEESINQKIKSLTLYAFSSENWGRPVQEINAIKNLIISAINDQVPELVEQSVELKFFGDVAMFGEDIISKIKYAESTTKFKNPSLKLNIALGYGGQQDILSVVRNISKDVLKGKVSLDNIDGALINRYSCVPESSIDLLIRTGGDKRISNFLLYQIAYSEICFLDSYWPDFSRLEYINCIEQYKKVSRRFGKRV